MPTHSSERGIALSFVLIILIVIVVIGGAYWYNASRSSDANHAERVQPTPTASGSPAATVQPTPSVVSGQPASVQEYTEAAYDAAVASGPVVLYYFANWCPICAVEYPKFVAAAQTFDATDATFFRVNYNDSETTDEEKASAREQQVGYQHTVVIVKNGQQTYKSMATGDYESQLHEQLQ